MKTAFAKISAVFMALLLLFSTMSFSVGMHFCGDHLVDFSLFDGVQTCGMQAEVTEASTQCALVEMGSGCCSDVEVFVQGQEDLNLSFDSLSFEQQVFATTFIYTYTRLFEGETQGAPSFRDYQPPPLIRDVQVLDQTFLI
jgi:hypothetical protein